MTILEAVKAKLRPYPMGHTSIEVAIIDAGLELDTEYAKKHKSDVNKVVIELLKQLLSLTSAGQSDVSLGFDTDALRKRLVGFMTEEGLDVSSYVKDRAVRIW